MSHVPSVGTLPRYHHSRLLEQTSFLKTIGLHRAQRNEAAKRNMQDIPEER